MGRSWTQIRAEGFPEAFGADRSRAIIDAVQRGDFVEPEWFPVVVSAGDMDAHYEVSNPIRLGTRGDSITPNVTMRTAQAIADVLGAYLMTPRLMDAAAEQADCDLDFQELWGDPADTSTPRMEKQSAKIDALAGGCPGLWVTPGKQWVLMAQYANVPSLRLGKRSAFNYGGFTLAPLGQGGKRPWLAVDTRLFRVWQPPADAHGVDDQADYSQVSPQLVRPRVGLRLPGAEALSYVSVPDVATSSVYAPLWTHEGVPSQPHHPWIPVYGQQVPPSPVPPTTPPAVPPPPAAAPISGAQIAVGVLALAVVAYFIATSS